MVSSSVGDIYITTIYGDYGYWRQASCNNLTQNLSWKPLKFS